MMNFLFVGIGGFFGALTRFYLGTWINETSVSGFPFGTLCVNFIGSFLLSFVLYSNLLRWNFHHRYILAVNTGFISSLTTFSTYSMEAVTLIDRQQYLISLAYLSISLAGGLCLSWLGIYLAYVRHGKKDKLMQV